MGVSGSISWCHDRWWAVGRCGWGDKDHFLTDTVDFCTVWGDVCKGEVKPSPNKEEWRAMKGGTLLSEYIVGTIIGGKGGGGYVNRNGRGDGDTAINVKPCHAASERIERARTAYIIQHPRFPSLVFLVPGRFDFLRPRSPEGC